MYRMTVNGKEITHSPGMTLGQIIQLAFPEENALAARVGGEEFNLNFTPKPKDGDEWNITPLTIHRRAGRRVYERTLVFILLMAARNLYPDKRLVIEHSLGQGLMIRPKDTKPFRPDEVRDLEREMRRLIKADLPLKRERQSIKSAVEYFDKDGQRDKVRLLKYRQYSYFDVYRCGDMVEYLYGEMAPTTSCVDVFALRYRLPGMILMMPDAKNPAKPAEFVDQPKLARALEESRRWSEILDCDSVADLNDMIETGRIREFIRINEALHEKSISSMADKIIEQGARAILIAGPSSSGKTTFTNRLAVQLRVHGKSPMQISLDDYYIDRDKIPVDENGQRDLEAIDTLDIERFNQDLEMLLSGEEVEMPIYSFLTGARLPKGRMTRLGEGQPVLIEGIHGLNERMSEGIPAVMKFKIYISALMPLDLDDHNRIPSTDARLLRRLVRDYHHRNATMEETLRMWGSVRRGEDQWIFPYQEQADVLFNSSLCYELAILKKHVYPLLNAVQNDSDVYAESRRLVKFLNYFLEAQGVEDEIPPTSLLREFIGGCTFYA